MKIIKQLRGFFRNFTFGRKNRKDEKVPLLIIKQESEQENMQGNSNLNKYRTIEEVISDLENDPNVPADKVEKLKASLINLKQRTVINIKNEHIIK